MTWLSKTRKNAENVQCDCKARHCVFDNTGTKIAFVCGKHRIVYGLPVVWVNPYSNSSRYIFEDLDASMLDGEQLSYLYQIKQERIAWWQGTLAMMAGCEGESEDDPMYWGLHDEIKKSEAEAQDVLRMLLSRS